MVESYIKKNMSYEQMKKASSELITYFYNKIVGIPALTCLMSDN